MASDLEDLHLADLHERAADAGIDGYRLMRREELIEKLAGEARHRRRNRRRRRERARGGAPPPPQARAPLGRGRGGGRAEAAGATRPQPAPKAKADDRRRARHRRDGRWSRRPCSTPWRRSPSSSARWRPRRAIARRRADRGASAGVLDLTRQRYGFLRLAGLAPSDGDVYVSAAQVRRCELRTGDEVAGPAREPRRGERHRALVHVDIVNGEEPADRAAAGVRRRCPPSLPERRIALEGDPDVLAARRRPAGAARLRPAGPGPRRGSLGPDDPAALARPRRRRLGHRAG